MATRKSTAKKPSAKKRTLRKKLSLVEEYLQRIAEEAGGHDCIYRGLPNAKWRSENSAARRIREAIKKKNKRIGEIPNGSLVDYHNSLLGEMRQKGFGIRDGRTLSDLELLTELQHFEAATCLLDFTESPLVALYFACANEKEKQKDGKLFILRNANLNTVAENDPIEKTIESGDLLQWRPPMHGEAERRIIRQSGVFIINLKPDEKNLLPIDVLSGEKEKILEELNAKYQISADTLFIDLAGFAKNQSAEKPLSEALAFFYCGKAKMEKEDWDGAIADYDEAIHLKPDFAKAYSGRGVVKFKKQDFDAAINDYTEAIRLKPTYAEAYFSRGIIKFNKKDFNELGFDEGRIALSDIIKDFSEAIRFKPDYDEAYCVRGYAKFQKWDYDGAIKDCTEAIRHKPDYANAYNLRGRAKSEKQDFDGAIKDITEAIVLNDNFAEAYWGRGLAKQSRQKNNLGEQEKDLHEAIKDFSEAIRLEPDFVRAYLYRSIAYTIKAGLDKNKLDFARAQSKSDEAKLYLGAVQSNLDNAESDCNEGLSLINALSLAEKQNLRGVSLFEFQHQLRGIEEKRKDI